MTEDVEPLPFRHCTDCGQTIFDGHTDSYAVIDGAYLCINCAEYWAADALSDAEQEARTHFDALRANHVPTTPHIPKASHV